MTYVNVEVSVRDTASVDGLDDHRLARRGAGRPRELEALASRRRRGVAVACEAVRERAIDDDRLVSVAREGEVAGGGKARVLRVGRRGAVAFVAGLHRALRTRREVGGVPACRLTAAGRREQG